MCSHIFRCSQQHGFPFAFVYITWQDGKTGSLFRHHDIGIKKVRDVQDGEGGHIKAWHQVLPHAIHVRVTGALHTVLMQT